MIKWYDLHKQLSSALVSFYENCLKDKKEHPGKELYKLLMGDSRFRQLNQWVEKFSLDFGVESLDPMHIFFSLHPNKIGSEKREKRAELLYELLLEKRLDEEINYSGCPAPAIIQILSARSESDQQTIWGLFIDIQKKGREGLTPAHFSNYKNWYGIEFKSFTIFLFYIDSDHFLPLESNVEELIIKIGLTATIQKNYDGYVSLLEKIDPYNHSLEEEFGAHSIFREISFWAWDNNVDRFDNLSIGMENLLKSLNDNQEDLLADLEIDFQFRMIAIRPLSDCDPAILNNLDKDRLYYFEKTIEISDEIKYFPARSIQLFHSEEQPLLNITAVVGKNGSGKSSLIELFFRIINNISYKYADDLGTENLKFIPKLFAEFYYIFKGNLYMLELKGEDISLERFELKENIYHSTNKSAFSLDDFKRFFYTIAVNYSHYALNAREIGPWINGLFHKNDGYQAPVVINPMRTDGNIDINKENSLTTSRLISMLLTPVDENSPGLRQVTDKQRAIEIKISLKTEQDYVLYETTEGEKIMLGHLKTDQDKIFKIISEVFELTPEIANAEPFLTERLKQYIIRKLIRMAQNYYPSFFDFKNIKFRTLKDVKTLVNKIKTNETHSAYKFKQAINYWKHDLWPKTETFTIDISKDGDRIDNFKSTVENGKLITLIPPSIFDFEIILENTDQSTSSFRKLSSGEKQLVYSVSSLLYHLSNLDSVHYIDEYIAYDTVNIILDEIELYYHPEWQKRYVNYLVTHIANFELPNIRAVNICFVTHSPYILSDIPDNYTLKLTNKQLATDTSRTFAANIHDLLANDFFLQDGFMGEFAKKKINETIRFLNIQSIWRDLKKIEEDTSDKNKNSARTQLITELVLWKVVAEEEEEPAEEQTEVEAKQDQKELPSPEVIERLIAEQNFMTPEVYRKIIDVIGEPILRHKLLAMYEDIFGKEDDKNEKIKQLEKLAEELNYNLSQK